MSFQNSLKILQGSQEFKQFKAKHRNSFLFSAFFMLNSKLEVETQQLDYSVNKDKVGTFLVSDDGIEQKTDKIDSKSELSALDENIKIDIEKLKKIIEGDIKKKSLTEFHISKIFVVLQKINNVQLWNVTCLMDCLKILRLHVDCFSGKILENKEENLGDFMSFQKGNKK